MPSRAIQPPKYALGSQVIVRDGKWHADGEIRAAIIESFWYDHKHDSWAYAVTRGSATYMYDPIMEKDILDQYTPQKLLHYVNKGL